MAKSVPRMADEFNLDFKELKSRDKAGYAFPSLIDQRQLELSGGGGRKYNCR